MDDTSEFWAGVTTVVASPVAIAAGVAKGTLDAASGNGGFYDGFSTTAVPIMTAARKFGAEHGRTITRGVIGGAATAIGARIVNESIKHVVRR